MKKILTLIVSVYMLMVFMPSVSAQELYDQMNQAFERLEVESILPEWDIQYATIGNETITLTCPKRNVEFKDVCTQLLALRDKIVTGNIEDAMSLSVRYYYSAGVNEKYLSASQTGLGMIMGNYGGLVQAFYGTTEIFNPSGDVANRRMDIYIHANGVFNTDGLDEQYFEKMKQILSEAKEKSHRQRDQLDYFAKWLNENTTYSLGVESGPAQLVINGEGMCDHYANAVRDFCFLAGIPCLIVENHLQIHAWNYLCIDNLWYEYDPTNTLQWGVTDKTLTKTTYGQNPGDVFTVGNLTYLKKAMENNCVRVVLDGRSLGFDQKPVIIEGRTLVPLRVIFEALGAEVEWIGETSTVVAQKGDVRVEMKIGNNEYFVNGEKKALDVPPQIVNGRTLVPARAVAESFDCDVDWMGSMNTVIINSNKEF